MKNKLLLAIFLIVFLYIIIPDVAHAAHTVRDGDHLDLNTLSEETHVVVEENASATITGSALNNVYIHCASNVTLTLLNATLTCSNDGYSPLCILGNSCDLILSGTSTLQGGLNAPGVQIEFGYDVTISGDGRLDTIGGLNGACIGARNGQRYGGITINSGTINAINLDTNNPAAGIGGAPNNIPLYPSDIVINGGRVTAKVNGGGAAIGSGRFVSKSGTIHIRGGVVVADSGTGGGAALGGGSGSDGGSVIIMGGDVFPNGNCVGSDIGRGAGGSNGFFEITGDSSNVFPKNFWVIPENSIQRHGWFNEPISNGRAFGFDMPDGWVDGHNLNACLPIRKVHFDSKDGSSVASITTRCNDVTISEPTSPVKTGCDFKGWYKDQTYIDIWDFDVDKITYSTDDNLMLYAKWEAQKFNIIYNSGDHGNIIGDTSEVVEYGLCPNNVPDLVADIGWHFVGFKDESDTFYTKAQVETLNVYSDKTFTAQYDDINVTGIVINKSSVTLLIDDSSENDMIDLNETVLPSDALDKSVSWESSDVSVATVDSNGLVTAVNSGTVVVTVIANDKINGTFTADCLVTVKKVVTSIVFNNPEASMECGTISSIDSVIPYTILPDDADDKTVTLASSNPTVATVSGGMVTALTQGITQITISWVDNPNVKDVITLVVKDTTPPALPSDKQGNVVGKLIDSDGNPLAGYNLTLCSGPQTVVTDSNGEFRFYGVSYDEHVLIVNSPTFNEMSRFALSFENGTSTSAVVDNSPLTKSIDFKYMLDTVEVNILLQANDGLTEFDAENVTFTSRKHEYIQNPAKVVTNPETGY